MQPTTGPPKPERRLTSGLRLFLRGRMGRNVDPQGRPYSDSQHPSYAWFSFRCSGYWEEDDGNLSRFGTRRV
jgi:hypothetical protein